MRYKGLELIKNLVHSSQKDLPIRRELFDEINSFFDEIFLLCLIC